MNHAETVFFQRFKKALEARHDVIVTAVTSGLSYEEYLKHCGFLHGLQEANDIADEIKNEMNKE